MMIDLTGLADLSGVHAPYSPSKHFLNLFNAYTKAVNRAYSRTGALLQGPFGRIEVASDRYYTNLIFYIHANPQKHGCAGMLCWIGSAGWRDWVHFIVERWMRFYSCQ